MTVHGAAAVGGGSALSAPALDDALVAVALAGAGDIHEVAHLEGVGLHEVADVQLGGVLQVELTEILLGSHVRLLQVAQLALGELALGHILEAHLDGGIAFLLSGLLLGDHAGARLDHGNGDHVTVLIEDLGHPDLLADDCFHVFSS